jgi:arginine:ornithine antiporter / lysine permease
MTSLTSAADSVSVPMPNASRKLRLGALTAMVVGSMVGSGVFSLPQNMAAGAGPLAILIGWGITGFGILALALVYQGLSRRKPELNTGPYAYAKAGFGPFIGFNSAWGYWISAWVGNVSYLVVMFSALSYFLPAFGEGNTWQAILGASAVLWLIHLLVLSGIQQAAFVNLIATIAKIAPIVLFIGIVVVAFRIDVFALDFTGTENTSLGSIMEQVKSTMLVTLWVFIGIEGASVYSSRAERRQDIGAATMLGFAACLAMYALVSLLSLGIMNQPELAALKNPSMAGVLEKVVGPWGAIVINVALVVSVLGAFLSWTLLAAEVPYVAAKDGTMPRFFAGENVNGAPAVSLWVTNGLVQAFLMALLQQVRPTFRKRLETQTTGAVAMGSDFKWRRFEGAIILWAVRWYCRYGVSYRDLEQMMSERGVSVDHSTIYRWVQKYAPEIEKRLRWQWRRPRSTSWRVDETYVKVGGAWTYLYRALDKHGDTIDFYLSPTRSAKAAKRFLCKALGGLKDWEKPEVINTHKAPTYAVAIADLKKEGKCPEKLVHRQVKYLNNVVEADHGKLKQLIRPVRGFKTLKTAYATIQGFEVMRVLRKGQAAIFNMTRDMKGEARIVERAFGIGPSALTEAVQMIKAQLETAAA